MKTSELKAKSIDELKEELLSLLRELFNLRIQKGLGQVPQPHRFKKVRRMISRVKTILSEKEGLLS